MANVFTNTFMGGMSADVDQHLQRNNTYRFAIGARLSWNDVDDPAKTLEENAKNGVTLAIANARGNRLEIALCNGYKLIGSIASNEGTLLLTTNGVNSEIGVFDLNDNVFAPNHVKYTTLYNDLNDPNGDKLNFNQRYYAHGFFVSETEFAKRFVWTDRYNQKRSINYPLFFNNNGEPYHNQSIPCGTPQSYPKWMSAHAFDERMDLVFPRIKFEKRIVGKCKSGTYQLCCKYISKTGHSSVWSPLTRYVFVTDQKMDGDVSIAGVNYPNAYQSNHHNRTMGESNIMTQEGLRWELTGLDTRWDQIAVAYVYHASSISFQEASLYKTYDISGSTLVVDLVGHGGTAITQAELNQRFETVMSVGTTAQQENRTWDGNIELLPDIKIDTSSINISPYLRYYRPDTTIEPNFSAVFNPVSGRDDNDPITNTTPTNETFQRSNFTGDVTSHPCVNDYSNYKGQQFSHLYTGYFRGETQPYAIVAIDRKGNPLFAQHISDYTFPNQFDTKDTDGNIADYSLTRQNPDGSYDIRIMGAKFSGIKFPDSLIRDKFGKLNISGFMIVKTDRIVRIANQGLMFNANHSPNEKTNNDDDGYVHPMEFWSNQYQLESSGPIPGGFYYHGVMGSTYNGNGNNSAPYPSSSYPGIFNYHSPDLLIEQSIKANYLSGQMQKVSILHRAFTEAKDVFSAHFYSKLYRTYPLDFPDENVRVRNGRVKMTSKSRIKYHIFHDKGPLHVYEDFDPEISHKFDYIPFVQAFFPSQSKPWKATQQPGSSIMGLLDWKAIDTIDGPNEKSTYPLVNWLVTPDGYYTNTDETGLENRRYYSTGHFQPITEAVLAKAKKTLNPNGSVKEYEFNDIEVWGGDCYVNLFDFTRMYPEYSDCVKSNGTYPDFSTSVIAPIESKYNLALLYGRRYAANCVMPQRTSCTSENKQLSNGITTNQPEDWTYNEVLLLQENTKFYFPKPANTKIVSNRPSGVWWSPKKIYGELEDSYRQRLVGDYDELIGSYGDIQRFVQAFNSLYVVQESAFGMLQTNLRSFIPTDGGDISVKSATVFGGIDYYSKEFGTQHPNSVWSSDKMLGFADARKGKQFVFSQAGLNPTSDNDGIRDNISKKTMYFDKEIIHSPEIGQFVDIIAGMDFENNEVLTSFHYKNPPVTLVDSMDRVNEVRSFTTIFNQSSGKFHGYSYNIPYIYFNAGRYLLAPHTDPTKQNQLFLLNKGRYGQYFGEWKNTEIEFIVNVQPNVAKYFNNFLINVPFKSSKRIYQIISEVDEDNIHNLVLWNNTGSALISLDDRFQYQENSLRGPYSEFDWLGEKKKLIGHYMKVKIIIDNSQQAVDNQDILVPITSVDTRFIISHPVQY